MENIVHVQIVSKGLKFKESREKFSNAIVRFENVEYHQILLWALEHEQKDLEGTTYNPLNSNILCSIVLSYQQFQSPEMTINLNKVKYINSIS